MALDIIKGFSGPTSQIKNNLPLVQLNLTYLKNRHSPAQHRNLGENRKKHTFNWNFTVAAGRFYTILIKWWDFRISLTNLISRPLYVCALSLPWFVDTPQGGVKYNPEGWYHNNLNLDMIILLIYTPYTHTHETCLLRQVGLQIKNIIPAEGLYFIIAR